MHLREAEEKDAATLTQLLSQLGYPVTIDDCKLRIIDHRKDGYKLLVSEVDNAVVGFIALHWYHAFHHTKPVGRIVAFVMDEKFRNKGLGSVLLKYAEDFLMRKGCFKIELTSNLRRKESHEYYLKKGYTQTSIHLIKLI